MAEWFFVIFVITGVLVSLISTAFWLYWLSSLFLTYYSRSSRCSPGALFGIAVALQLLFVVVISCASAIPFVGPLIISSSGFVGWIVLGVLRVTSRRTVRLFRSECPLPKMQFSMIDLYTGILFFALAMTVCSVFVQAAAGEPLEVAVCSIAAYFLVVTYLGFYTAMDILRRAPKPLTRKGRLWTIVGVMAFYTLSLVVGALIAWRSWQKALQSVSMDVWQRTKLAAQKQAAVRTAVQAVTNPAGTDISPSKTSMSTMGLLCIAVLGMLTQSGCSAPSTAPQASGKATLDTAGPYVILTSPKAAAAHAAAIAEAKRLHPDAGFHAFDPNDLPALETALKANPPTIRDVGRPVPDVQADRLRRRAGWRCEPAARADRSAEYRLSGRPVPQSGREGDFHGGTPDAMKVTG